MSKGLYLIRCSGYADIYALAESFDDAVKIWLFKYINVDEKTGKPTPINEIISPMPDTVAFIAPSEEVIIDG